MKVEIPHFIRHDFWRKAVALFFAILIWVVVSRRLKDTRQETLPGIPVRIEYNAKEIILEDEAPLVKVTFSGTEKNLRNLRADNVEVKIRLEGMPVGTYRTQFRFSPKDHVTKKPYGLEAKAVEPEVLDIYFDHLERKGNVPVRLRREGAPPTGYSILKETIRPPTVSIEGPSKILREIRDIPTEIVRLDGATEDFSRTLRLAPIAKVKFSTASIDASFEIAKTSSERAFHNLPVYILSAPRPEAMLSVANGLPMVSVNISGPKVALEALTPESVLPFVQLAAITNPGDYRRPVHVWVAGTSVLHIDPPVVELKLVADVPGAAGAVPTEPAEPAAGRLLPGDR